MSAYDAVLVYHTNGFACGVTKFSTQLAKRLGVPCRSLSDRSFKHPLLSIKASELPKTWLSLPDTFDVLWHDCGEPWITALAQRVFYADEIGCPSTVEGNATRGAYRVLVFGMANKLLFPHFINLKRQLDQEHPDYTIELSTAVHEGSPWDETLAESTAAMRAIFGERLRVLGFLADDALARVLQECDAVAAFYLPALRANNTTAWAAVEAGKTLFTNCDAQSPTEPPTWDSVLARLALAASATTTQGSYRETRSESRTDYTAPPAAAASGPPSLCP